MRVKVSLQEAGAFRRFRSSADAVHIKNVLLRELNLTRDVYEDTVASEENRVGVNTVKRVIKALFEDELEREDGEA